MKKIVFPAAALAAFLAFYACSEKDDSKPTRSMFIMNVPARVTVYGASDAEGGRIADAVLNEWKRISAEYSFSEPYGSTAYLNNKAYGEWVKVEDELLKLLSLAMDYYKLTGGAFDVTCGPLWPIWTEAASSRIMPAKEEINKALLNIGSGYVQLDRARKLVRFTRPVQVNMGGLLRGYCFARAYKMLKELAGDKYAVKLRLGGYMLAYGRRNWSYDVADPFHDDKTLGRFFFPEGALMSSSGRDHFVQIEGKLYSHILDLKTGYPISDFSNMIVYFPTMENDEYLPSVVLAVMGKDKAFQLLGRMKGTAAVWIDGSGDIDVFLNADSKVRWEKSRRFF
ncbi:MAG: FAD:protein FMN transferase [Elusimicrobia bacterium]|nr:FAD:protein FMN transferase [Elusimicrobiota bacterium]